MESPSTNGLGDDRQLVAIPECAPVRYDGQSCGRLTVPKMFVPTAARRILSTLQTCDWNAADTYRPDVDGLRAIAALSVVFGHAGWLPGGGYGVDVFFVISGFLISRIILRSLAAGQFSFANFYARRTKRIFPALIALLSAALVVDWTLLRSNSHIASDVAAGAAFVENFWLYLTLAERTSLLDLSLTHLWTLGIEEQFYLLWPMFLHVAWRSKWMPQSMILAAVCSSLAVYVWAAAADFMIAWCMPWSRLWELAIGGMLACAQQRTGITARRSSALSTMLASVGTRPNVCHALGTFGIACLCTSLSGLIAGGRWSASAAFMGAIGSFLVIAAGPNYVVNRYVLSTRVLVYVGLISYPLYLWHAPLFMLADTFYAGSSMQERFHAPLYAKLAVIVVSVLLSHFTYRYLELPIRSSGNTKKLVVTLCVLIASCGLAAYLSSRTL